MRHISAYMQNDAGDKGNMLEGKGFALQELIEK